MKELIVRPAVLNDIDVLLEFERGMIEAEQPFDDAIRTDEAVRYYDLEEMIVPPHIELVVAELDSELIGCGYARIEDSKPYLKHRQHAYLGFMYVAPEHRGKGVNKRIIEALEQWSASQGVTEMRLEVYTNNPSAIRAYEKCGYSGYLLDMRKSLDSI